MNAAKIMNIVQNTKYLRKFNMIECCFEIFFDKINKNNQNICCCKILFLLLRIVNNIN